MLRFGRTQRKFRLSWATVIALFGIGAVVATCATPTPYQPAAQNGGYAEKMLEPNRYRISFFGNSLTSREQVEDYLLYRAAELTVEQGGDYFVVVERDTDTDVRYRTTYEDPWPYYGGYYGYRYRYPYYVGAFRDSYTQQITRYTATADVVVYKGQKTDNPQAYDARAIMQNLGPGVIRPQAAATS